MTIRFATPADAPAILAIYGTYILESTITFEYEVPAVEEFAGRIRVIQQQYPFLVAESEERVLGYAYATRHNERMAYQWSVNTSVYVLPEAHRKGIGRSLYAALFELLRRQGYHNAFAGITRPNPESEALHRAFGFELIGTYTNTGYKFGAWHSVSWFQLVLQPYTAEPAPPVSVNQIL